MTRARSRLPPPPPPRLPPSPRLRRTRRRDTTLCVYALTAAGSGRVPVRGIAGESLRVIRVGAVAAIAGELPRPPRPTPDNLRRYDALMQRLALRFPSLLPARFTTSFDDTAELSFVLRSRQASLRRALAHVRGRVQMTVRVVAEGEADAGRSAARNPPYTTKIPDVVGRVARSGPRVTGTDYLRARAAATAREREVAGFEPIRSAVRRWIRDERVEKHARVASVYHLIPRASAESYRSAASRAAAASGTRSVISGPWPPYAFASW